MLLKSFSDDWKWWIWNYVKAENNKEDLFVILLNHGFYWDLIANELNYMPKNLKTLLRRQEQKVVDNDEKSYIHPLYKPLADNPKAHRLDNNFAEIYTVENFLSDEDCDFFINKIRSNLTKSTVTNPDAEANVRTSRTSYLRIGECEKTRSFNQYVHDFLKIPIANAEEPQGQLYQVGQEFKPHNDWFDPNSAYNQVHLDKGQRTWTFMIYLNSVERGGATRFIRINNEFTPKKGLAVFWNNLLPNKQGNPYTEHWGMPVESGEKIIITKWFREHDGINKS